MSEIEVLFERLSSQYLSKITEERKKADELQMTAINNTLREWSNKFQNHLNTNNSNTNNTNNSNSNGKITSDHENNLTSLSSSKITDHDLLKDALTEAKDRQAKIISVWLIYLFIYLFIFFLFIMLNRK